MDMMNGMAPMGPAMILLMILVWALVIGGVVWLVRRVARRASASRVGDESPESTLKKRYANGEIDRATYQRMLEDLGRGTGSP